MSDVVVADLGVGVGVEGADEGVVVGDGGDVERVDFGSNIWSEWDNDSCGER